VDVEGDELFAFCESFTLNFFSNAQFQRLEDETTDACMQRIVLFGSHFLATKRKIRGQDRLLLN
jgi:hypothetical protein